MSAHVAGSLYLELMNLDPANQEYRRAFVELALQLVPPRGSVFDFGSGTGIDARRYAAAGLTVGAYDCDTAMREYFVGHCAAEIEAGSVRLHAGSYAEFLRAPRIDGGVALDLVVANFAPLNLVTEPAPLFQRFATMLNPSGRILVSVLNPWFHALRESGRPWLRLAQLFRRGYYATQPQGVAPVVRWRPRRLAREAAPDFALTATYAPATARPGNPARRIASALRDFRRIADTQFLFLQFERRAP